MAIRPAGKYVGLRNGLVFLAAAVSFGWKLLCFNGKRDFVLAFDACNDSKEP